MAGVRSNLHCMSRLRSLILFAVILFSALLLFTEFDVMLSEWIYGLVRRPPENPFYIPLLGTFAICGIGGVCIGFAVGWACNRKWTSIKRR